MIFDIGHGKGSFGFATAMNAEDRFPAGCDLVRRACPVDRWAGLQSGGHHVEILALG